jgi:drug/metabolite transporter (DMT)-like permease
LVGFAAHALIALFSFRMPEARDVVWLFVAGLSGGLAQLAMTRAFALTEAARLGAVGYLGTVMSFTGSIVFLGERPGFTQIAGALLVIGSGIALALLSAARR